MSGVRVDVWTGVFGAVVVLAVVEMAGIVRLWPFVYRWGIRVWRESRPLHRLPPQLTSSFRTASGAFRPLSADSCVFTIVPFAYRGFYSGPFVLKNTIRWNGPDATIEARLPLTPTLLLPAFLVAWAVAEWSSVSTGAGLGRYLFGFAVPIALMATIPLEIRHVRAILDEYDAEIDAAS